MKKVEDLTEEEIQKIRGCIARLMAPTCPENLLYGTEDVEYIKESHFHKVVEEMQDKGNL